MVLVNNPGDWDHVYPPLLHSEWNGCTPTDLVFPFFLFIVGAAMAFSFARYEGRRADAGTYLTILRRTAILFGLGLLLNGFPFYNLATLRILGVLQRIALAYLLASLVVLNCSRHRQWLVTAGLLVGYWLVIRFVPVPGGIAGDLSPAGNLGAYLDRLLLGTSHLYLKGRFDPEGLLGTLPATATVFIGYLSGHWLRGQPRRTRTSLILAGAGGVLILAGWGWGQFFPINKSLWTSSYVLLTSGWALGLVAACFELVEVRGGRRWGWPFEVLGLNAIFLFVGSGLVGRVLKYTHISDLTAGRWLYEHLFAPWTTPVNASLAYALATVALWWLVLWVLYRRQWFLKV